MYSSWKCDTAILISQTNQVAARLSQRDFPLVCILLREIQNRVTQMYSAVSNHNQTLRSFPAELVMLVATFNARPTLRSIGLVCKQWQTVVQSPARASMWTQSIFGETWKTTNRKVFAYDMGLLEFKWLKEQIPISERILRAMNGPIAFTADEEILVENGKMWYGKIQNWQSQCCHVIVAQAGHVGKLISVSIQPESLRYVTATGELVEIQRGETMGGLPCAFNHEKKISGSIVTFSLAGPWRIDAHAWSPTSFFAIWRDPSNWQARIAEYDFYTCKEVKQRNLLGLFRNEFKNTYRLFMTWMDGKILLLMVLQGTAPTNVRRSVQLEMILLDWKTDQLIRFPLGTCLFGDLEKVKLARIQIHGQPLVHLSLTTMKEMNHDDSGTESIGDLGRIHVWLPSALPSYKRKG